MDEAMIPVIVGLCIIMFLVIRVLATSKGNTKHYFIGALVIVVIPLTFLNVMYYQPEKPFDNAINMAVRNEKEMWCQETPHHFDDDTMHLVNTTSKRPSHLKIAYLIMVHSIDTVHSMNMLLKAIWRPDFHYLVLADKNMPRDAKLELMLYLKSAQYTVKSFIRTTDMTEPNNVKLMLARVDASWGGMGLVQNELDGFQKLLTMGDWDYVINLSGDSFPLVSQSRIVQQLQFWYGRNFVTTDGMTPWLADRMPQHKKDRMKDLKFPIGVYKGYMGSQWVILTREFVKFSLFSSLSRNLLLSMANAFVPDEMFFQTLIQNSVYNMTTIRNSEEIVRAAHEANAAGHRGHSFHPICRFEKWYDCQHTNPDHPRPYPCFLGWKEYDEIIKSGCIFGRKFDLKVSEDLYISVQEHIEKMEADEESMKEVKEVEAPS